MPPPLRAAAAAPADHSGMNPLTYSDPTGDEAIRQLLDSGGPFTITAMNGFHVMVNRESLDYMLLGMTAKIARPKKNRTGRMRSGLLWLFPIRPERKTPIAATFGDRNSDEGPTETPNR